MTAQIDHKKSFDKLPWYRCEGLFCSMYAPFAKERILFSGTPGVELIAWCGECRNKRGRYICTQCALREGVANEEAGWQMLVCRYCGTPLGKGEEVRRFCELDGVEFDASKADQSSLDEIQPIPQRAWGQLYQHAIKTGLVTTSGMQQALLAKAAGDNSRSLLLLNEELDRCRLVDYQAGIGRCLLEMGRIFLLTDGHGESLKYLDQAEPILRECTNKKLLRECLGCKVWLQKFTNAPSAERLAVLNEAIKLYREALTQGIIQSEEALEFLTKEIRALRFSPAPHPDGDPEVASQRNLKFQQELSEWNALPWWKKLTVKKPQSP
jgi:hypothetical protein